MLRIIPILVLLSSRNAHSYSSGAPGSKNNVCSGLKPSPNSHGEPQSSSIPYKIKMTESQINPDDTISMTLSGNSGKTFKGFMVQIRDSSDKVVGEFLSGSNYKFVECPDPLGSITHSSPSTKSSINFNWKASNLKQGDIIKVFSTVLEKIDTFWTNEEMISFTVGEPYVESESESEAEGVAESEGEAESEAKGEAESEAKGEAESEAEGEAESEAEGEAESGSSSKLKGDPVLYTDCQKTKGCFGLPASCVNSNNCQVLATYQKKDNDRYLFTLRGKSNAQNYMAIGLSEDGSMGDDLVMSCRGNSKPEVVLGWNFGRSGNTNLDKNGAPSVYESLMTSENGYATCSFETDSNMEIKIPGSNDKKVFNLDNLSYHLLIAEGAFNGDSLLKHRERVVSGEPVSLKSVSSIAARGRDYIIVHGSLMIVAWMLCCFIGTMIARYFKDTWKDSNILGKPVWFFTHRAAMSLCVVANLIAFIVILIEVGGWQYDATFISENPHPAIGLATVILGFIQPIMAFFRPHPGTEYRWVFNWAHWLAGNSAQILGIISILLAPDLSKAGIPVTITYIVASFVILTFLVHFILTAESFRSQNRADSQVSPTPKVYHMEMDDNKYEASTFKRIVFGFYVICNIVFSAVVIGFIAKPPGK